MMSQNQMGDIKVRLLKTVQPEGSNDAEFFPGMPKTWSTGFMINEEEAPTGRSAGSLAWAGFGNTYFWIDLLDRPQAARRRCDPDPAAALRRRGGAAAVRAVRKRGLQGGPRRLSPERDRIAPYRV